MEDFKKLEGEGGGGRRMERRGSDRYRERETVGFADVKIGRDMMHANYR